MTLKFSFSPIPSPAFPTHHARWTYVPKLVGLEYRSATTKLYAIWPCVHVRAAGGTPAFRIVVVAQKPAPGTRLPAYGVKVGQAFRPTTLDLTVAAR